jgi:hypothetical protein
MEVDMTRTIVLAATAMLALGATAYAARGSLPLGPSTTAQQKVFRGFYDGHHDVYLVTDVSNKAQAKALGINYSAELAAVKNAPAQYFIEGRAAAGQLSVFGSEPGEADYNPLWEEKIVTWKAGVKPVLLVKDDQIKGLAAKQKLTVRDAHIVLNAPITKIEK